MNARPVPETGRGWQRGGPGRQGVRLTSGRRRFAAAVLIPIVALFVAIRGGPIVANLLLSLTNYRVLRRSWRFVGLDNFRALLDDPAVWKGLINSLVFAAVAVPGLLVLSLLLALAISRSHRTQPLFQAVYFLPFILPAVASTTVWKWIYTPGKLGIANAILAAFHLGPVGWLTRPATAVIAILVMYVWKQLGLYVVIFLVGLKSIPQEYREAAMVDGASGWEVVRRIELPLLRPHVVFGLVYATILASSVFTEVYVMTQGSDLALAAVQVDVLTTVLYREGFVYLNTARASAVSVMLFVVVMTFLLVQIRLIDREKS